MIVKNEEETLERCLSSFNGLFDEIIIVDTGSQDKTKDIAKKFTNKIYDFKWCDDFSKARNFGISKSTCDYFMWLDADDIITKENLEKMIELKKNISNEDVFMLKYDIAFDENNNPTFSYYRERICKNNGLFLFKDPVHEAIIPSGNIKYIDISIEHRKIKSNSKSRNLKIYEKLKKNKIKFTERQQFYYSRELFYNNKIHKAIINFKKFLKIPNGYIENKIEACRNLSRCYQINGETQKAKNVLFSSFNFDTPRAETLCELGYLYKDEKDYINAIYYFNLASLTEINYQSGAFIQKDYYNYIPYLELCVCYFHLKEYKKAYYYNNLAKNVKPYEQTPLKNEEFLKQFII